MFWKTGWQLGFDSEQNGSMYDKDYELSAMATRSVPKLHPPPDAGHVRKHTHTHVQVHNLYRIFFSHEYAFSGTERKEEGVGARDFRIISPWSCTYTINSSVLDLHVSTLDNLSTASSPTHVCQQVLQKDDEYRNLPKTSHRHHFMKPTPLEQSVSIHLFLLLLLFFCFFLYFFFFGVWKKRSLGWSRNEKYKELWIKRILNLEVRKFLQETEQREVSERDFHKTFFFLSFHRQRVSRKTDFATPTTASSCHVTRPGMRKTGSCHVSRCPRASHGTRHCYG